MLPDLEIYRAARILIEARGDGAERKAAENMAALQAKGDAEGAAVWRRVIAALAELRREAPEPDEPRN